MPEPAEYCVDVGTVMCTRLAFQQNAEGQMRTNADSQARIDVEVPPRGNERREHELGGFARYCILRIERELGARDYWKVRVGDAGGGHASTVTVQHRGETIESRASHSDAELAIWDAMCRIEQRLRYQRLDERAEPDARCAPVLAAP
jgi:hypothetical protein